MTLYEIFTENEIRMILEALEFQEKKWRAIAERPVQGYGRSDEFENKKDRKRLSEEYADLQTKICENTD